MTNQETTSAEAATERRFAFFGAFLIVLLATYGFLALIDFLPEPKDTSTDVSEVRSGADASENTGAEPQSLTKRAPLPTRVIIDKLDTDVAVLNPEGRSIEVLDAALQDGLCVTLILRI